MTRFRLQNKRISSRIPLGYDLDEDGETLIENPTEMATIKLIEELKAQGMRTAHIARKLKADGVKTKSGGQWYSATVIGILNRQEKVRNSSI